MIARRVLEVLVWTAVATGVWLTTLSSVTGQDLLVAVPAAVLCGTAALGMRMITRSRWRLRVEWLRDAALLPIAVPVETYRVLRAVLRVRRPSGHRVTIEQPKSERADVAATRRAVGGLVMAASPAAYVVDTDPRRRQITVHVLVDRWRDT